MHFSFHSFVLHAFLFTHTHNIPSTDHIMMLPITQHISMYTLTLRTFCYKYIPWQKIEDFQNVTSCLVVITQVSNYRSAFTRIEQPQRLFLTLRTKALGSFETSVITNRRDVTSQEIFRLQQKPLWEPGISHLPQHFVRNTINITAWFVYS